MKNSSSTRGCLSLRKPTITNSHSGPSSSHVHGCNQSPSVVLWVVTLHAIQAVPRFCSSNDVQISTQLTHCRLMSPCNQTLAVTAQHRSHALTVCHSSWNLNGGFVQFGFKPAVLPPPFHPLSPKLHNKLTDIKGSTARPRFCYGIKHITVLKSLLAIRIWTTNNVQFSIQGTYSYSYRKE